LLTSIIAAAVILALLIIVHETGHFAVAKRLGVRVLRFSIGYPPKVWGIRHGETEYAIGATPFGGYVRMLGEEVGEEPRTEELELYVRELALDVVTAARKHGWTPESRQADEEIVEIARRLNPDPPARAPQPQAVIGRDLKPEEQSVVEAIANRKSTAEAAKALAASPPRALIESFRRCSFPTQSLGRRFLIVLAGPVSNILFAPILLTIVYMYGVPALLPIIGQVKRNMPAHAAGLMPGDNVISVNGKQIDTWATFSSLIKSSNGAAVSVVVERGTGASARRLTLVVHPKREDEETIYGNKAPTWVIGVLPSGKETVKRLGPIDAVEQGVVGTFTIAQTLVVGIARIVEGVTPVRQALGGPIMIAQMAGQEARQGFANVALFTVMLSLELGIINLLPVPLLDGGPLLFFVCEAVRGKPLKLRTREIALQVGLLLLVALMAFVIFNDISRIVQG
jgi:regulator of sigma E protease